MMVKMIFMSGLINIKDGDKNFIECAVDSPWLNDDITYSIWLYDGEKKICIQ